MLSTQSSTIFTKIPILFYCLRGFVENKLSILVIALILNSTTNRYRLSLLRILQKSAGNFLLRLIFWRLHLVHIAIIQVVFSIHRISQFGSWKFVVSNKTTRFFSSKISQLSNMITISRTYFWLFWILRERIVRLLVKRSLSLWLKRILVYRTSDSTWWIVRIIWNLYILLGSLLRRRNRIG